MQERPTDRELLKRMIEAKEALLNGLGLFANMSKAVGELYELEIGNSNEIWKLIRELLDEISPSDYCGGRPPQKSYEKVVAGRELFAFCWWSKKLSKKMYLKFVLKDGRFYYVSLHASRSEEQGE